MDIKKIVQSVVLLIFGLLVLTSGCYFTRSLLGQKEAAGVIMASGRIEGDEYHAASKIAGKVEKLLVQEGDEIKKGDLIALLSSKQIQAQYNAAEQDLNMCSSKLRQAQFALQQTQANTRANLTQAQANLKLNDSQVLKAQAGYTQSQAMFDQAQANLNKAKANFAYNQKEYLRYKNLVQQDAIPKTKFDAVETQYLSAREDLKLAEKEVEKAHAGIKVGSSSIQESLASVQAAQAGVQLALTGNLNIQQQHQEVANIQAMRSRARDALAAARADLEDTKIYAPTDGTVVNKIIQEGEVIAQGTPVITIINLDKLYLRVYLPTEKAGQIKIGNLAEIIPDAFADKNFSAKVYKISSQAEFTPKNVETKDQRTKLVFEVRLRVLDNRERALKPGMPAEARIKL